MKEWLKQALIAAMYVTLVLVFSSLSYLGVQYRIAEILLILVLFNRKYTFGLLLGTFIANLFSPLGVIDWIVGVVASGVSIYLMLYFKNKKSVALLMPPLVNGVFVGFELWLIFSTPFWLNALQVFIGEFVVVFVLGHMAYHALKNNKYFLDLIA